MNEIPTAASNRRSVYVYWKRASPHPMMTLFDASSRESACVGRSHTDTPLQSLALLNETGRVESARVLAERVLETEGGDAERMNWLFQRLVGRNAREAEARACLSLLAKMRIEYAAAPHLAKELIQIGDAAPNERLETYEVAAWTQVTTTVFASDPVILLY